LQGKSFTGSWRPWSPFVISSRQVSAADNRAEANFDSHRDNFSLDSAALQPLDFPRPNGYIWR
jgi:hypothetical protein